MQLDRFHQLVADGGDRVERGHGLLEDHGDLAAPYGPHLRAVALVAGEVLSVEDHLAPADEAGRALQELHHGQLAGGLAAARLAHDADDLVLEQLVGEAVHGVDDAYGRAELHPQVAYIEERRLVLGAHHIVPRRRGSRTSRSPSPTMLKAKTNSMMQTPGATDMMGFVSR